MCALKIFSREITMEEKKRAYISVYDKTGIVDFCRYLVEYGYELVATEGTANKLRENDIPVLSAHDLTGYPEPLGGKVRAVHPAIYTGIIASRLTPEQLRELDDKDVFPIQLVVVNLYPFREDMEAGVSFEEAASHIDAGGVALLDAAAKNFMHTVTVCDPEDYDRVLCNLAAGAIPEDERKYLTYKAFSYTAAYDALVAQYLSRALRISFPKTLTVTFEKAQDMRYGENPHQKAAVYREPLLKEGSLARAKQLAGPALTYNSLGDANTALELVKEFDFPTVVVCKHCAPSCVGTGVGVWEAFGRVAESDPLKLQNAIVAINAVVDARVAAEIAKYAIEAVIAVGFTPEAMAELRYSRELILLEMPDIRSKVLFSTFDMTKIYGGLLVQNYDTSLCGTLSCVTKRKPTEGEARALVFNYKVAKHALSSAVVIGTEDVTYGVGTGQVSRSLALSAALQIAGDKTKGAVLASEASFASKEYFEECVRAGITAVVCTGEPDADALALCNEKKIAVLVSEERHFKN